MRGSINAPAGCFISSLQEFSKKGKDKTGKNTEKGNPHARQATRGKRPRGPTKTTTTTKKHVVLFCHSFNVSRACQHQCPPRNFDSKFSSALLDIKQSQTGELLWRDTGGIHWRMLASSSGSILAGYSAGSTGKGYSAGCSAGSAGKQLWRDTRRDPLASRSGGIIASRDPLTSRSGGILGGIHWRAALAGYWAGSTGEQLWRDTRRDPLASCSGGILGGIHRRAALAGYWVGAWCRSIANADSNINSNNPFLPGGQKKMPPAHESFVVHLARNARRKARSPSWDWSGGTSPRPCGRDGCVLK